MCTNLSTASSAMNNVYICGFNGFEQIGVLESFLQGVSTTRFQDRNKYEPPKNEAKCNKTSKIQSDSNSYSYSRPNQIQTVEKHPRRTENVDAVETAKSFSLERKKTENLIPFKQFTWDRKETETDQADVGHNEDKQKIHEGTHSNAVFMRKICSLPDTVQFAHVEMSWSRIGITMSILKDVDFSQQQLDPNHQKLHTKWHQLIMNQYQHVSSHQQQNICLTQNLRWNLMECEPHLNEQVNNPNQQETHLSQPDPAELGQHFTTIVCGFSGAEQHDKEPKYLLLDECELKASNETGMLLQQADKILLLGQGSRQVKTLSVVSGSCDVRNVSTVGSVSGMASKFVASYDVISVGELCVEQKEKEENAGAQSGGSCPGRLLLSCLDSGLSVKHVSCGLEHSLFLTSHGTVLTCGSGSRGQLGHGQLEAEESPRAVSVLEGIHCVSVAAGGWHSAAVTDCGDIFMWGWNECGQLGLPCPSLQSSRLHLKYHHCQEKDVTCQQQQVQPMAAEESAPASLHLWPHCVDVVDTACDQSEEAVVVSEVACGTRHTAVLTAKGLVFTTGWNKYKQLGLPHSDSVDHFTRVYFPDSITSTATRLWCGAWNSMFVVQDSLPISSQLSSSLSTAVSS